MNREELLKKLHSYSKAEKYLKDHPKVRFDSNLHDKFNSQLTPSESNSMLVPLIPSITNDKPYTFPNTFFFKPDDQLKIRITQHTRFSSPILHTHNYYEMFYVLEGEFSQIINNKKITMETGDVCLMQPGVYHSLNVDNYSVVLNILIDSEIFENLTINNFITEGNFSNFFKKEMFSKDFSNYLIFHTLGDCQVKNYILDMNLELINKYENYSQAVSLYLLQLFTHLLRHYKSSITKPKFSTKESILKFQFITEIEKNYKTITLTAMASKFNYSPQYISKSIKEASGLSFKKYLIRKRLSIAISMLRDSNKSIKEISEFIGYSNVENFIRLMKEEFHQSPLQFRKNSLQLHSK